MLDYKTKAELLVLGVRTSIVPLRRGGGGPVGGIGFAVKDSILSAPAVQSFAKESPYRLLEKDRDFWLYRGEEKIGKVKIPRVKYYEHTIKGISAGRFVALDGVNALVTAVTRKCVHVDSGKKCVFCVIEENVPEKQIFEKDPEDIAEAVKVAFEEDKSRHLTLTTGTPNLLDKGALKYSEVARRIKAEVKIPIHAQIEPVSRDYLELLYSSGIDTIGIHVETYDERIRKAVVPGKPSIEDYLKAWENAVEIFGEWNVSSWILVGLGESVESVLEGFKAMAERGVYPYIAPYRPPPSSGGKTDLSHVIKVYDNLREFKGEYDIKLKFKAGCPRCTGCSAILELLSC
ncbi:MAG: radical SAM protein [Archaeoglobaceae archaeon]|nr:radical SAM protein [Archaeoglobaceae archaeon]MDW8117546.1 radical SAM protein [Archaeoglobaceae archaeon]